MGKDMVSQKARLIEQDGCRIRVVHLERVGLARQDAIPQFELDRLALTYKVLGDPTRLRIVMALAGDEMCVCDLAAFLGLSESAVSHQLRRLKDLALVKNRREGPVLYYSLDDEHVADLLKVGLEHVRE
jgi:DNA-binding transcriptional ArsR family regulator